MWSKAQIATFQRALAASQKWQTTLGHLQELAKHSPAFEDRVNDLVLRATNVETLATIALSAAVPQS